MIKEIKIKFYDEPVVRLYNPQQAYFYIKEGVNPIEIYPDTEQQKLVYVFTKKETKDLYTKWISQKKVS